MLLHLFESITLIKSQADNNLEKRELQMINRQNGLFVFAFTFFKMVVHISCCLQEGIERCRA